MSFPSFPKYSFLAGLAVAILLACVSASHLPAQPAENPAITILRELEEINGDLQTLHGRFVQVRQNRMFDEEITSRGEFWYTQPNRFRADYLDPSPMQFWMIGNVIHMYTPEIRQVDRVRLDTSGGNAPINHMLVGFGMKTETILEVFNVRLLEAQSDDSVVVLEFQSKDTDRTLDFQTITVTFERGSLTPKKMHLMESEDEVTIDLTEVRVNADIASSVYDLSFPEDATVVDR